MLLVRVSLVCHLRSHILGIHSLVCSEQHLPRGHLQQEGQRQRGLPRSTPKPGARALGARCTEGVVERVQPQGGPGEVGLECPATSRLGGLITPSTSVPHHWHSDAEWSRNGHFNAENHNNVQMNHYELEPGG